LYVPKYYKLYELLPKKFYEENRDKGDTLWFMFDNRLLWTADQLRIRYGKMSVNTWFWEGNSQYRGWRPWDCGIGAELSQHKFGKALDLIPHEITSEEIRQDIKKDQNQNEFKYITCIEDNISWTHLDVRNWNRTKHGILFIKG